jgi:hypothetical protein
MLYSSLGTSTAHHCSSCLSAPTHIPHSCKAPFIHLHQYNTIQGLQNCGQALKKNKKRQQKILLYMYTFFTISLFFFNEIIQSSYNIRTHKHTPSIHLVFDILKSFNVKYTWLNWVTSLSWMF